MPDVSRFDIAIVGAGPAGIRAARAAAGATSSIVVIDQSPAPGGQIWRRDISDPATHVDWLPESTTFLGSATVVDGVTAGGRHRLLVEQHGRSFTIETATLILATGARELFLPFPGWTLPGVVGVGGLQALMKSGLDVRGKRIVIAGSGPLLLPVASTAVARGADVAAVIEQVPLGSMARFSLQLLTHPVIGFSALHYLQSLGGGVLQYGRWVAAADGNSRVRSVAVGGDHSSRIDCDLLATGYGLVPNTELAKRLGCDVQGGAIVVDAQQRTSIEGVFAAGECTGVGGVSSASTEGTIAGGVAVGRASIGIVNLLRSRARRWGQILDHTFAPRPEVLALARPDTIVCRCEDVRLGDLDPSWSPRQAKLYARAGMGACQGRVCGAALQRMFGWTADSVRPPLQPTPVSSLLGAS
jgi:NADPH-dependent 2,4-dienoyl-CoA reductase/sulfur reductase-like enzyme